jgi:hypothetical protein
MGVHEGWLYAGTFSTAGVVKYFSPEKFSERVRRIMDRDRIELLAEKLGGCALWRTRDGVVWIPVTTNGFGNPFNYGIRALISTPHGLFVGTANPFGPDVAVHRASGWQYENNPRGGLEIWLGSHHHAEGVTDRARPVPPPVSLTSLPDYEQEGLTEEERRARFGRQRLQEFFRDPAAQVIGYWRRGTRHADEAAATLAEELVSLLPAPLPGSIQVFAADAASAHRLLAARLPEATRLYSGAGEGGSACTAAIDLEALSRRPDKERVLTELLASLPPGGCLVGAALLHGGADTAWRHQGKDVTDAAGFQAMLASAGWHDVVVTDATREGWQTFSHKLNLYLWEQTIDGTFDGEMVEEARAQVMGPCVPVHAYVLYRAYR